MKLDVLHLRGTKMQNCVWLYMCFLNTITQKRNKPEGLNLVYVLIPCQSNILLIIIINHSVFWNTRKNLTAPSPEHASNFWEYNLKMRFYKTSIIVFMFSFFKITDLFCSPYKLHTCENCRMASIFYFTYNFESVIKGVWVLAQSIVNEI